MLQIRSLTQSLPAAVEVSRSLLDGGRLVAQRQSEQGASNVLSFEQVGESKEIEHPGPWCSHVWPTLPVLHVIIVGEVPHPCVPVQVLKGRVHHQQLCSRQDPRAVYGRKLDQNQNLDMVGPRTDAKYEGTCQVVD